MDQQLSSLDDTTHSPAPSATNSSRLLSTLIAALAGLAAAALGLGVAELVAGLSPRMRSPVYDVGDRVIDLVPSWLKDIAIELFGTKDKLVLLLTIAGILAVYAAILGVLGLRRNLAYAVVGVALFGLIGSIAALNARTGASWLSPLPSLVGALVTGLALWGMSRPPVRKRDKLAEPAPEASERRRFLMTAGAFAAGAVILGAAGRRLEARFSATDSRNAIKLPTAKAQLTAVPAGAQAQGAASFYTSNADFYRIDTALTVPQVPAEQWNLRIKGLVDRELNLSYSDVLARNLVEHDITLTCVSNTIGGELMGTARWLGIRLDDLLDEAGIDPAADQIVGRSVDGYTCGFPVSALDGRDALVAIGMNGEPLPLEHGFPARLIVPGLYGYVSATKWLTEIELTTFAAYDHYWVPRGYAVEAPIKLQSRIDSPRGLDRIDAGPFVIGGVAWAQTVGIDAVDVRIDEGPWQQAIVAAEVNDTTWRQWSLPWEATPGRHSIEVRAIDRNGAIQTADRAEPLPNGASGHHTVVVLVNEA